MTMKSLMKWMTAILFTVILFAVGYWTLDRYLLARFTQREIARTERVKLSDVKILQLQQLGFWTERLKFFHEQDWVVLFEVKSWPPPASGTHIADVNEPSFATYQGPFFLHSSIPSANP